MKKSSFQFRNPVLAKLEFGINEGFNKNLNDKQEVNINMAVQVNKKLDMHEAEVSLSFELGDKDDSNPFYVAAIEKADFRWDDVLDDNTVEQLLNQNAPSLLLSYLRPIIAQITAASPYDSFDIPFINFKKS